MSKKRCEIICVGTELLLGDILNTNAQYIAKGLSRLGLDLYVQTVVGDNVQRLEAAIRLAMSRAEILLFTGGLGPTSDDLTKEVAARCLGSELVVDEEALAQIRDFYALTRRPMPRSNEKQALMPKNGRRLDNPQGTAPGCLIFGTQGHIAALMPGPPREMQPMLDEQVLPFLRQFSEGGLYSRAVRVVSLGESRMAEMLTDLIENGSNPTLAPYAKDGEAMVRVTTKARDEQEALAISQPVITQIISRLGRKVYGVDVANLETVVASLMHEQGLVVGCFEAGSSGLAAHRLQSTDAGHLVCGPCISSPRLPQLAQALGLKEALPEDPGLAVSLLAEAACERFSLDAALVVAVQTQDLACAVRLLGQTRIYRQQLPHRGQDYYRVQAVQAALDMLRLMLLDHIEGPLPAPEGEIPGPVPIN